MSVDEGWLARAWARIRGVAHPASPRPADAMHWAADAYGIPYCGARLGLRWTREPEAATCEECRKLAAPIVLQWRCNVR